MNVSYENYGSFFINKDMNKMDLKVNAGVSTASIAKLGKGKNIISEGF